jgi:hypothetical protein
MKRSLAAILAGAALIVVAAPAAAGPQERVGSRINVLFGNPTTYPAGQPFHVAHGWSIDPQQGLLGKWNFALEVDGVPMRSDFVERNWFEDPEFGRLTTRFWVYNFPSGLPGGTHTLTGRWQGPCRHAPDGTECSRPSEVVDMLVRSVTVTFTP